MSDTIEALVKERGAVYGHPLDDFTRVNEFSAVLDRHFRGHPALKHALYMVCVKMARLCQTPDHRDSVADGQGYFKTYGMVLDRLASEEFKVGGIDREPSPMWSNGGFNGA